MLAYIYLVGCMTTIGRVAKQRCSGILHFRGASYLLAPQKLRKRHPYGDAERDRRSKIQKTSQSPPEPINKGLARGRFICKGHPKVP